MSTVVLILLFPLVGGRVPLSEFSEFRCRKPGEPGQKLETGPQAAKLG